MLLDLLAVHFLEVDLLLHLPPPLLQELKVDGEAGAALLRFRSRLLQHYKRLNVGLRRYLCPLFRVLQL